MNDNEIRKRHMFVRVRDFGAEHTSDFADNSLGKGLFTNLAAIVTEIDTHAASEVVGTGSARHGTSSRTHARTTLRESLEAIKRTARPMSKNVAGIDGKFRIPRNTNDQLLLNAARAFANDAAPLKSEFIARELPEDFLTELSTAIGALETAISNQASGAGDHIAASADLDDAFDRGVEIVRELDAIIKNKYDNNPGVLAEWTSASHTERAPRRRTQTPPPPSPSAESGATPESAANLPSPLGN